MMDLLSLLIIGVFILSAAVLLRICRVPTERRGEEKA
jgi:Zn-dependent membrane protease YugP